MPTSLLLLVILVVVVPDLDDVAAQADVLCEIFVLQARLLVQVLVGRPALLPRLRIL